MSITIKCKKCGDILQSKHRHDYVTCSCGACAIDGGEDYCRITGNKENWEYYNTQKESNKIIPISSK